MGWNYWSILKFQQLYRWSLGMDKKFHLTLYWVCDYLSMLGLKLIHVSKSSHWWLTCLLIPVITFWLYFICQTENVSWLNSLMPGDTIWLYLDLSQHWFKLWTWCTELMFYSSSRSCGIQFHRKYPRYYRMLMWPLSQCFPCQTGENTLHKLLPRKH